ncbi:ATP-binding cassette domain-containing protein [Gordonia sp. CPCC 206044]|uniref:ABC transporter ATP-binding protein n=1 Tax=Gordonia sp. CPCC 206044 TaxID=3140793 RepID=UPI003AF34595
MNAVLRCRDLDAGYAKGRPCVRGLDIDVHRGEILALLGPNGAGKTTGLVTLAGLLPGLGGTVEVDGKLLPPGRARAACRAGLVLVPDNRALFTTLTAEENLRLATRGRGKWTSERDTVLDYFPGLANRLKVAAGALSGGEQQMLAIGRALVQHPRILLIDELSMGLAPVIVERLLPVIRQVADDTGTAVIIVEQHVGLALGIADTAMVLRHGVTVLRDDARTLAAAPELIEHAYLGDHRGSGGDSAATTSSAEASG